MIIPLRKFLVIGAKEDIDAFFHVAQQKGFIEFISPKGKKIVEMSAEVQNLIAAMKILRKLPVRKPYEGPGDRFYAFEIAERIVSLKHEIEKHYEEKRLLEAEIYRVAPFGNFSFEDIDFIEKVGKRTIQFFCMKTAKSHKTNFPDNIFYIGTDYDLDYFIAINPEPKIYPDMIEMRVDRSVGELKEQLALVDGNLHERESELKQFASHLNFLHEILIEELNEYSLASAKKDALFPLDNALFVIEAWVPDNKVGSLFAMQNGFAVHCEEIAVEATDRIPTYMENKGAARLGEDLVLFYDVPAATDKDPSGWVFWAFALFFAMIIGDAGYGLIYLGLAIYLKYKFPTLKGKGKRFLKLFAVLSVSVVIWGALSSSYFGLKLAPNNFLNKVSLVHYLAEKKADYHLHVQDDVYQEWVKEYPQLSSVKTGKEFLQGGSFAKGKSTSYEMLGEFSDNILLEFSLLIGVIHISLSFLRYMRRNLAGIGWIIFMVGGYLFAPSVLRATSLLHFMGWVDKAVATQVGEQMIYIGIILAVLLALVQKRLRGLPEVTNVIQVFADVLSYLRLYALGLAGAILADTFNDIGASVGFAAGALVVLLGHVMNITIGVSTGVIHGLRLNFLEWYRYSFEGGGRLFKPLKRNKI